MEKWPLVGRLKRAVNKVRFLLNFNLNRWMFASMASASPQRRLSFEDRPGLAICTTDDGDDRSDDAGSARGAGGGGRGGLQRTISYPSSEDDIDKRAEMFIANFYHHLRLERQTSLELRYCRGNSFESRSP